MNVPQSIFDLTPAEKRRMTAKVRMVKAHRGTRKAGRKGRKGTRKANRK